MGLRVNQLDSKLAALDGAVAALRTSSAHGSTISRWRADLAALRFHLTRRAEKPIVAVLGGTGTGKSTIVNRLLDNNLTATSFRRTYTAGAIAITSDETALPDNWLGVEHVRANESDLPARGRNDALIIVTANSPLIEKSSIIDTPDLDGDQPQHHAQADRVFRWADAILFIVTPEKYQMTELLPYYRLAERYGLPSLHLMNKCEEQGVFDDYQQQLKAHLSANESALKAFVVPRDDAAYHPPAGSDLNALRDSLTSLQPADSEIREQGLSHRTSDLIGRFSDQILSPLARTRQSIDYAISSVRAMIAPAVGIDLNPVTLQLQRRLQQRSVLYLMGPQRMLDRLRQAPMLLARLPRTAWDLVMRGQATLDEPTAPATTTADGEPDFPAILADQFRIVQSRIDDIIRSSRDGADWIDRDGSVYAEARIDPAEAGRIAEEELAELRTWLQERWNATPRDTAILNRLLKHVPGGKTLSRWSEAAPYLLAIVTATHNAMFGPIDLVIIGGFSLATWISEKLSNEVAGRTRQANRRISERFEQLVHQQIERVCAHLDTIAPSKRVLADLSARADSIMESLT